MFGPLSDLYTLYEIITLIKEHSDRAKGNPHSCQVLLTSVKRTETLLANNFATTKDLEKWENNQIVQLALAKIKALLQAAFEVMHQFSMPKNSVKNYLSASKWDVKFKTLVADLQEAHTELAQAVSFHDIKNRHKEWDSHKQDLSLAINQALEKDRSIQEQLLQENMQKLVDAQQHGDQKLYEIVSNFMNSVQAQRVEQQSLIQQHKEQFQDLEQKQLQQILLQQKMQASIEETLQKQRIALDPELFQQQQLLLQKKMQDTIEHTIRNQLRSQLASSQKQPEAPQQAQSPPPEWYLNPSFIVYQKDPKTMAPIQLGSSALGTVYKALYRGFIQVAVKQLTFITLQSQVSQDQAFQVFNKTLSRLPALIHENLLGFVGAFYPVPDNVTRSKTDTISQTPFIVMQEAEKKSLNDCFLDSNIDFHNKVPLETKAFIIAGISNALSYLNSQNIIHGHLHPSNVLLDSNWTPKLSDYLIGSLYALLSQDTQVITGNLSSNSGSNANESIGSAYTLDHIHRNYYLPPEMRVTSHIWTKKNQHEIYSKPADVWAFGVICAEIVLGTRLAYIANIDDYTHQIPWQLVEDRCIRDQWPEETLLLLRACLQENPIFRPTLHEIDQKVTELHSAIRSAAFLRDETSEFSQDDAREEDSEPESEQESDPDERGISKPETREKEPGTESEAAVASVDEYHSGIESEDDVESLGQHFLDAGLEEVEIVDDLETDSEPGEDNIGSGRGDGLDQSLLNLKTPTVLPGSTQPHSTTHQQGSTVDVDGCQLPLDAEELVSKAKQGDPEAQYELGKLFSTGKEGHIQVDYKRAFLWLKQSANQNNADAEYELGVLYQHGFGVKKSLAKAREYFEQAKEKDHLLARFTLLKLQEDKLKAAHKQSSIYRQATVLDIARLDRLSNWRFSKKSFVSSRTSFPKTLTKKASGSGNDPEPSSTGHKTEGDGWVFLDKDEGSHGASFQTPSRSRMFPDKIDRKALVRESSAESSVETAKTWNDNDNDSLMRESSTDTAKSWNDDDSLLGEVTVDVITNVAD